MWAWAVSTWALVGLHRWRCTPAVNHRRLSTRVRRTWARVGRDGSRRRAERAHQFQSAGPVRVLGAVSHGAYLFRSMSLSCGDRPGVLRVTALNSTPVIFYPTDSVTFDRTPSALRLPPIPVGDTGRVPHHEPFTRVHPLSPHIVSSEMRLGNASLTASGFGAACGVRASFRVNLFTFIALF